tara:strand:- start:85 stop:555 length:471 start_codon:yes stop_codon:yes gene_type:complete
MRTIRKTGDPVRRDNTRTEIPLDPSVLKLLKAKNKAGSLGIVPPEYNQGKLTMTPEEKDSILENILEFVDPTGITSHDDARRAYESMRQRGANLPNFNEFVDMLGALPVIGKVGKGAKATSAAIEVARQSPKYLSVIEKLIDAYDSGQDIYEDNIK